MNTWKRVGALALGVWFLAAATISAGQTCTILSQGDEKKVERDDILTKEEASDLRKIIYERGLTTHINLDTGHREVALRNYVVQIHKKKRIGTIKLLLEIVKGGRPEDALAAGVTALALEKGPVYAVGWGDVSLDSFDKADLNDEPTERDMLTRQVEKALASAEKQSPADGNK